MNKAYRVKVKVTDAALPGGAGVGAARLDQGVVILLWSIATAVGVGTGWYIALATGSWFLAGVPLGVCQGLVLLPRWKRTLGWVVATSVGWVIGFALMAGLGTLIMSYLPADWWVTESGKNIGWAIALLPFVGVPAVAEAQWIVMRRWVAEEPWIFWFGVSVCSFPVASFIGLVLFDPRQSSGTLFSLPSIQPLSQGLWLIGALWGICTGWALWMMPEVAIDSDEANVGRSVASKVDLIALIVAGAGLVVLVVNHLLNVVLTMSHFGQAVFADDLHLTPYWISIPMFVALGYTLARGPSAVRALLFGLVVILADLMVNWASVLPLLLNNPFSFTQDSGGFEGITLNWGYMLIVSLQQIIVWGLCVGVGVSLKHSRRQEGEEEGYSKAIILEGPRDGDAVGR